MMDYGALAGRPHGGRPTVPILLSDEDREALAAAMRPAKAEQRIVRRAQALLMMADGVPGTDIARVLGVHVLDAPRSGRPLFLSPKVTQLGSKRKPVGRRAT